MNTKELLIKQKGIGSNVIQMRRKFKFNILIINLTKRRKHLSKHIRASKLKNKKKKKNHGLIPDRGGQLSTSAQISMG